MEFLIGLLGIIAVVCVLGVVLYNRLVALRQVRHNAFADVDVQLQMRFDLVPNLVETVKGYATHEQSVFENVTAARAGVGKAKTEGDRLKAEGVLGGALLNLFAVAEDYPDLKADKNFQKLQDELSDIENKISAARRFFNNATNELNTAVEQFPSNIIAQKFGFEKEVFYELDDEKEEAIRTSPNVKFGS